MEPAASSTTTFPLGGGSIYQPLHLQSVPSRPTSARGTPRQSLRLQVRTLEGEAWWLTTDPLSTWLSIKQKIMELRGIDVIMQKLICAGRILQDEATLLDSGFTERDFLVLVTAKPRPPALMTTGAPLPSSYPAQLSAAGVDDGEDEGEDELDGEAGDDELDELALGDGTDVDEDAASRLVDLGFAAHEAHHALRLARNNPHRALELLRGELPRGADARGEAMRSLHAELRAMPAFHALQQVVRVDPQIMLVLNTEEMRFEDQKSAHANGHIDSTNGGAGGDSALDREAVEAAFWEACAVELCGAPPVYERTLQLVHELRDALCSLMPAEWAEQLEIATEQADHLRSAIDVLRGKAEAGHRGGRLPERLVVGYMRCVGAQVRALSSEARAPEWRRGRETLELAEARWRRRGRGRRRRGPQGGRRGGGGAGGGGAARRWRCGGRQ